MGLTRKQMRERVELARQLVENSTMPEHLKKTSLGLLRAPNQRQVTIIIALAKRYPPEEENESNRA